MVAGLGLAVSDKALAHPDARVALRTVLRAWLPLSDAVLGMAVEHLPDPAVGDTATRICPQCGLGISVWLVGLTQLSDA